MGVVLNPKLSVAAKLEMSLYGQLRKRCLPLIEHYHDDLLKYDRNAMLYWPGVPYVHFTRTTGTHLTVMRPLDSFPAKGVRVPYLFADADREHILKGIVLCADYYSKSERHAAIHYFSGYTLTEVDVDRAMELINEYADDIRRQWSKP
jgi:hypothetical protein